MNTIVKLLCILVLTNLYFAQENPIWKHDVELYCITTGLVSDQVRYKMTAQSPIWDIEERWSLNSTGSFQIIYYPVQGFVGNTGGGNPAKWASFAQGFNITGGNMFDMPSFGYGLYKLEVYNEYNQKLNYFFIDYRDSYYPSERLPDGSTNPYSQGDGGNDIWLLYDANENQFMYSVDGCLTFTPIMQGSYQTLWEIKVIPGGGPHTQYFDDYWSNALGLCESGQNPMLVWGNLPNYYSSYNIYRSIQTNPSSNPSSLTYSLIANVNNGDYVFIDQEIILNSVSFNKYIYYYVKANNENTNIVSVYGKYQPYKTIINKEIAKAELITELKHCFPNPFNPTTKIKFAISEFTPVTLIVYDSFGRKVETLINELKPNGIYEVMFHAENLSSGVYFYQLKTNTYIDTKKMMLIK